MKKITIKRNDARLTDLVGKDPKLKHLFDQVGDLTIETSWDYLPFLVFTIIGQQISTRVVAQLYQRILHLCNQEITAHTLLTLSLKTLKSTGLSMRKAEYITALAEAAHAGHLDPAFFQDVPKEDIFKHLTRIRGIGPWTVDMFLMFALNDWDHFSLKDLGLIHGYTRFFNVDKSLDDIEKDTLNWRPYRSLVAHYLWYVHDH